MAIIEGADTMTPVRLIVPLTLSESEVDRAVDKLLASGTYTPDDLLDRAVITRRDAYYVPVYVFEGSYEAIWSASFGYDRIDHYTDYHTRTDNGETRTVPVSHRRVVTDWRPANGIDAGDFTVTAYAGARLASKAVELVESGAVFGRTQAYQPSFTSGLHVEAPLGDNDVFARRAKTRVDAIIDRNVKAYGQGNSQRDWHWTARITERTATPALLPIRHVVYEYEGKTYNVWFDGADMFRHAADPLPQDQRRKRHVNLGYVPAAAASAQLFFAGLTSEPSGPFGAVSWSTAGIVAGAWMFSAVRAFLILSDSSIRRAARLAERTATRGAPPASSSRARRVWPTNRFADMALVALATIVLWTVQSHVVDTEREAKLTAARQAAQAQAAQWAREELDRAAEAVRFSMDRDVAGTRAESMLIAAARDDWTAVDALAHKTEPVSPARRKRALDVSRATAALKAGYVGAARPGAIDALRVAPDSAKGWLVMSAVWCDLGDRDLARQGFRLMLHLSADRRQALAALRDLETTAFASPGSARSRDLLHDVRNTAGKIP